MKRVVGAVLLVCGVGITGIASLPAIPFALWAGGGAQSLWMGFVVFWMVLLRTGLIVVLAIGLYLTVAGVVVFRRGGAADAGPRKETAAKGETP